MKKPNYKLCILSAGKGTRNRSIEGLHKSLLPVENRSTISYIIEKFHEEVEIVIALGYKAEQVRSYIETVFPNRNIRFVFVENFEGKGSGPGYSLLKCKEHLQCPFIFTSSDTIIEEKEKLSTLEENWIGTSYVVPSLSHNYCLIKGGEYLQELYRGNGEKAYNGIAGIFEYDLFWNSLQNYKTIDGEHQVLDGFRDLGTIKLMNFTWHDTGNVMAYKNVRKKYNKEIVASKDDEAIFIEKNKVIKYFSDPEKIQKRISRTKYLNNTNPPVEVINENMYAYDYIKGKLLSNIFDENLMKELLSFFIEKVSNVRFSKTDDFLKDCDLMYRKKIESRIALFSNSSLDKVQYINGVQVPPIDAMLKQIDWDNIYEKAIPSSFHGDFQPENIIYDGNSFKLIDWRGSFGNNLETGDMYYDLGKLYHALLINGNYVLKKRYKYSIVGEEASIHYDIKNNLLFLMEYFEQFCLENSLCWKNVQLLGILQYIGICPLYKDFHNGEYGEFLFLLGKYLLANYFKKENK